MTLKKYVLCLGRLFLIRILLHFELLLWIPIIFMNQIYLIEIILLLYSKVSFDHLKSRFYKCSRITMWKNNVKYRSSFSKNGGGRKTPRNKVIIYILNILKKYSNLLLDKLKIGQFLDFEFTIPDYLNILFWT